MKNLSGKTAVVTGAAMGMGRLLSSMLMDEGCSVALVDVNQQELEKTQKEFSEKGTCKAYVCDITDAEKVYEMARAIREDLGDVYLLVNNAGIVKADSLLKLDDTAIQKTIDINLTSQFWTVKAFMPQMISRNEGHIVNVASAGGLLALPKLSAYCASKFGVVGFTESLRQEIKKEHYNIDVTVVCPYTVSTGMFKGTRVVAGTKILTPEKVCKQIMRGIKGNKAMIAIPTFSVKFLTPLVKSLLPVHMMDWLNKHLGMWEANDTWVGRS